MRRPEICRKVVQDSNAYLVTVYGAYVNVPLAKWVKQLVGSLLIFNSTLTGMTLSTPLSVQYTSQKFQVKFLRERAFASAELSFIPTTTETEVLCWFGKCALRKILGCLDDVLLSNCWIHFSKKFGNHTTPSGLPRFDPEVLSSYLRGFAPSSRVDEAYRWDPKNPKFHRMPF